MSAELGTISGRIHMDSNLGAVTSQGMFGLKGLQQQAAATALGLVGAGSITMAMRTVTNAVSESVQGYMDYEEALAEVSTLVDTSVVDMNRLSAGVQDLSKKYGAEAGGLTRALYQTISAGIDAADSLSFLETAQQAATAGATDTKTAVSALASAMNAFGMNSEQTKEIADSMFVTIKKGVTTLAELSPAIGQVAPLAAAANVSLDEMNAALATMTLSGMSTSESATALKGVFAALIKPTDDAIKLTKALNIEWGVEGVKAAGGFAKWIKILEERTGGSAKVLAKLIPNIRGLNGALVLTGEGAEKFASIVGDMETKLGAAEVATLKMMETSRTTWKQVGAWIADASRTLGEYILKLPDAIARREKFLRLAESENKTMAEALLLQKQLAERIEKQTPIAAKEDSTFSAPIQQQKLDAMKRQRGENDLLIDQLHVLDVARQKSARIQQELDAARTKSADDAAAAAKKHAEEALELAKKAVEAKKRMAKVAEAILDKEKERLDFSVQAELDKFDAIEDMNAETAESIHNMRIIALKDQVELWDKESKDATNTEKEKLQAARKGMTARRALAQAEADFATGLLKKQRQQKIDDANGDIELLKTITDWFDAKSEEISAELAEKIDKEIVVNAEAMVNLNEEKWNATWDKINRQVSRSIGSWGGNINNTLNTVMVAFRSSGEEQQRAILATVEQVADGASGIAGMFDESYGGFIDTVAGFFKLGWNIGEAIWGGADKVEAKWRAVDKAASAAADSMRSAIGDWLKSQGLGDLSDFSLDELQGKERSLYGKQASEIGSILDVDLTAGEVSKLQGLTRSELTTLMKGETFDPESFSQITINESTQKVIDKLRKKIKSGTSAYSTQMGALEDILIHGELGRGLQEVIDYISGFDVTRTLHPEQANSFSSASTFLRAQQEREGQNDDWYDIQLKKYADRFSNELSPSEYSSINQRYQDAIDRGDDTQSFAGGGIAMRKMHASIADAGVPEAVIPLDRIGEVMSNMGASSALDINVRVHGETASAEVVGRVLGDRVVETMRARGL